MSTQSPGDVPGQVPSLAGSFFGFDDVVSVRTGRSAGVRLVIPREGLVIGRGTMEWFAHDDASVSREHAAFRRIDGTMTVVDLGSKSGTFVAEKPIAPGMPVAITSLARIRIGETVMRFVHAPQAELDPDSGLPAGLGLIRVADAAAALEVRALRVTQLVGISLPALPALLEERGMFVHRTARDACVDALKATLPDCSAVGLIPDFELVAVRHVDPRADHLDVEGWLRILPPRLAMGARVRTLVLSPDESSRDGVRRLRSTGASPSDPPSRARAREPDATTAELERSVIDRSPSETPGYVLALEFADRSAGPATTDSRSRACDSAIDQLEELLLPGEEIRRAGAGLLLVHLRGDVPHRAEGVARRLADSLAAARDEGTVRMESAIVPPDAQRGLQPASLVEIALQRIDRKRSSAAAGIVERLPHPLVGVAPHADGIEDPARRLLALHQSLEAAITFVGFTFVARAAQLDSGMTLVRSPLLDARRDPRRQLPFGAVHSLVTSLAHCLKDDPSLVGEVARSLARDDALRSTQSVVERRNLLVHGGAMGHRSVDADERAVRAALAELFVACQPFASAPLVAISRIDEVATDDGSFSYLARAVSGTSEVFPIRSVRARQRLPRGIVALVPEDVAEVPLPLSPHVALTPCSVCSRTEVFMARRPSFAPAGTEIEVRGLATGHRVTIVTPDTSEVRALASLG